MSTRYSNESLKLYKQHSWWVNRVYHQLYELSSKRLAHFDVNKIETQADAEWYQRAEEFLSESGPLSVVSRISVLAMVSSSNIEALKQLLESVTEVHYHLGEIMA